MFNNYKLFRKLRLRQKKGFLMKKRVFRIQLNIFDRAFLRK